MMPLSTFLTRCPWDDCNGPTGHSFVYLLVDANDQPLYVGRTYQLATRIGSHRRKPWWADVADIYVLPTCCIDQASPTELRIIRALRPPHNIDPRDAALTGWETRRAS